MQSKSKIVLSKHTCCALSCRVARYMESHPARVRESKHAKLTCNTQVVAPTRVRESKYTIRRWCLCRTSRGCANQNNTFFFLAATGIRRTLHGCANRNPTAHIEKAYGSVAPCTGARIEMWQMRLSWQSKCRTSRGCANRNGIYCRGRDVAPHAGERIEIIHARISGQLEDVAPHAGARIEITIKRPLWQKSHPNMGVGIEIPESRL